MTDRVLVTGVSGFLGGYVALELLRQGYVVRGSVRNLDRSDKVTSALAKAGADTSRLEFTTLDLLSDAGWAEAMEGVRYLQHVASPFLMETPRDRNVLIRPAVEGTRRALTAAFSAGVERVVLTSSIAAIVYGHGDSRRTFTTADWTDPNEATAYPESKLRAEKEAWTIADSFGARDRLAVINPGAILGPLLDDDPGTSGALIGRLLDGSVPGVPKMTFTIVDVRDVAAAQATAMQRPEACGHRHILAEREMTVMEIAEVLRARLPTAETRRIPRFEVPNWLVRLVGLFDRQVGSNAAELGTIRHVDPSSGRALLGRPMISGPDAVLATAQSLFARGLVG